MRRAVTALLLLASAGCSDTLDARTFRCEEAMAHLDECCPGLPSSPVVCDAPATVGAPHPGWTCACGLFGCSCELHVDCLVDEPCSEMQGRGVCAWAQAPGTVQVCP